MTATEELRRMLDERGVKWRAPDYLDFDDQGNLVKLPKSADSTMFMSNYGLMATATEYQDHCLMLEDFVLTPDEVIEVALGRGECRDVCNSVAEFTCSACGFNCDLTSWISLFDGDEGRHRHHHHGTPNYCPNCGRAVRA